MEVSLKKFPQLVPIGQTHGQNETTFERKHLCKILSKVKKNNHDYYWSLYVYFYLVQCEVSDTDSVF